MGGYIKREVEQVETTALNTQINKEIFDAFKDYCKEIRYPMNVVLETFMQQYSNGRFDINKEDILKWKKDKSETDTLNTTFNKEIYIGFKDICKSNKYFVKHVITAFMEKFATRNFIMEYVNISELNDKGDG